MKHTRIAIAIVALAMVPSSGILGGGGALRPRSAAAGPWGTAVAGGLMGGATVAGGSVRQKPAATLNGKAKRDLGMAVFLSPSGLGALLESEPRTLESRVHEWLVPTPITAVDR